MIYSLENSIIKITVSSHGGEIHSITEKSDGTDYLWNGDPKYWKYHAPILFPIIGKLVELKYTVDGNVYELPSHGIARISDFNLVSQTNNSITFELKYNEDSLKVYPYKFCLQVTYALEDSSVIVSYKVINLDNKQILFSIGAHPAFICPIYKNEKLEDYYLEFNMIENSSAICFNQDAYFTHQRKECLSNSNIMNLSKEIFKDDALVFDNLNSDKITIKSKNHNKALSVQFTGFNYMGIWAPAKGAPFVCIEPWLGHADFEDFNGEFKEKEGIISLEIGKEFNCSYKICID